MSDLLDQLRERVDARVKPHVEMYGDDAPVVKMARLILQDAEEIATTLAEDWRPTAEASAMTGWRVETLQRQARAVLDGESLRGHWKGLMVRDTGNGYEFVIGSVPKKRESAA
jgi:hypothetical protein